MPIERPNALHSWIIYKEEWICDECGCCENEECSRCTGSVNKPCNKGSLNE